MAADALRNSGYAEKADDGRYRVTGKQRMRAPRTPRAAGAREARHHKTAAAAAPAAIAPAPVARPAVRNEILLQAAAATRSALEAYIQELGDPILEHLVACAAEAAQALALYRTGGH